ncbi:hypothetical protein [Burkholderia sp. BCC0405]|uniref:hypothetical protein n=1 Tax=Burkholderia sp. BCC0405 TaxID=2676298 RepID=UPI001589C774|nr:hypothetical protein [Burkholderia sp. BCC0405]
MSELVREVVIVYASYGYLNKTIDVTDGIRTEYKEGARTFYATNRFGDPDPGVTKALVILWEYEPPVKPGQKPFCGITLEGDKQGIKIG